MLLQQVKLVVEHTPFFAHRPLSPPLSRSIHPFTDARITQTAARQKSPGKDRELLRCGKVILVFGPCADVRQANAVTALAQKLAAARENAQNSGSRRFQNSPPHTQ